MSTTAEKVGRVFSGLFCAANAVTLVLVLVNFLHVRAKFAGIFKDLGAQLPTLTTLLFAPSPSVLMLVAVVLLALLIAKEWLRPVWVPMFLNGLWLALGCAVCLLIVIALFLPMLTLISQVTN